MKWLLIIVGFVIGFAVWRNWKKPTAMTYYYKALNERAWIGDMTQMAAVGASIPVAMVGEGTLTTFRLNVANANPFTMTPTPARFNFKFAQPTG